MGDDAEKKYLASLDFKIDTGLKNLDTLFNKLQQISQESEKLSENMTKKLSSSLNSNLSNVDLSKFIDEDKLQKTLKSMDKYSKQTANKVVQNLDSIHTAQEKATIEANKQIVIDNEKTANKLKVIEARNQKELTKEVKKGASSRIAEYAKTYLIYQGFNQLKQAAVETVQEMVEVESQMVAIERVMEEGSIQIDEYRDKLIQLAYDYGNSFDNVADVTLRLAQAGFDANESLALTEKTLLALNTADLNATEATEDMVAVMAQWGLMTGDVAQETEDYAAIIDKINKVADSYPTTSADIMEALKKTSSAFNIAGASIDETIATIVAAETASQRGGKAIGTALSNITQQLKDVGKIDIAESLGISFYTDETKAEFKDLMDIFGELSKKMQQLKEDGKENSIEMQNLLSVFTIFRRNIGASLLGEMAGEDSTYAKVLQDSLNAVGYSVKENEKYMKTAKAAQEQFNATLLELKTAVWDNGLEDVFRSMLLLGGDVANAIKWLVDTFGALSTILGVVTLAFSTFNKNMSLDGIKKAISNIKNLKETLFFYNAEISKSQLSTKTFNEVMSKNLPSSMKNYISNLKGSTASLKQYVIQTTAAKVGTLAFKAALSVGLSVAVSMVVSLIDNLIHKQEDYIKSNQELIEQNKTKLTEYNNEQQTIEDLIQKYQELSKEEVRTPDINKEILSVQKEIKEILGEQAKDLDLINGKYEEQYSKIIKITAEKRKQAIEDAKTSVISAQTLYSEGAGDIDVKSSSIQLYIDSYKDLNELYGILTGRQEYLNSLISEMEKQGLKSVYGISLKDYKSELEEISTVMTEVKNRIDSLTGANEKLNNLLVQDYIAENFVGNIKSVEDYQKALEQINNISLLPDFKGTIEEQRSQLKSLLVEEYPEFAQKLNELNIDNFNKNFKDNADGIKDYVQGIIDNLEGLDNKEILGLSDSSTDKQKENYEKLIDVAEKYGISITDLIDKLVELEIIEPSFETTIASLDSLKIQVTESIDKLANLEQGFETVYSAMNEFNEYGYMSAATLNNLIDNDLLKYFDVLNGKLAINEAAMANDATAAKINAAMKLQTKAATEILSIANQDAAGTLQAVTNTTYDSSVGIQTLTNDLLKVVEAFQQGTISADEFYKTLQNEGYTGGGLSQEALSQISGVMSNLKTSLAALDSINISSVSYNRVYAKNSGSSSGGSSSGGSSTAAANAAKREAEEAAEAAEKARKAVVENFEEMIEERERLENRWVKNKKALGLISDEDEKYILQQSIQRYKKYAEEVNQLTMATEEEKAELRKKYLEEAEDLEVEYFELLKDLLDEQIDAIEEKYDNEADAYEEMIDSKIEKIEQQADAEIEALEKVEDVNDRIRQKEEYEASRRELIHGHQGIEYWQQRTGREAQIALAEAQKELEELDKNWEETTEQWSVEDQITLIEQRRDADIEATEAEKEAYLKALEETKNAEIKALKDKYQYQIDYFNETGEIIVDNATIQAREMFEAYKTNFIDPVGTELKKALAAQETTKPATTTTPTKTSTTTYTIKYGDTLSAIARSYGTTIEKILAANPYVTDKNLIYAGKTLQIPTSHTGSKIIKDGLVELQAGETVLNMDWAKGLDKMLGQFNNQTNNNNTINNGSTINIDGSLVKVEANIEDKTDAVYLTKRITKELTQKFNLKK